MTFTPGLSSRKRGRDERLAEVAYDAGQATSAL